MFFKRNANNKQRKSISEALVFYSYLKILNVKKLDVGIKKVYNFVFQTYNFQREQTYLK